MSCISFCRRGLIRADARMPKCHFSVLGSALAWSTLVRARSSICKVDVATKGSVAASVITESTMIESDDWSD